MLQSIRCLFEFHDEVILGKSEPMGSELLLKCNHCKSYGHWEVGNKREYWSKNVKKFPEHIQSYIETNKL